LTFFALHGTSGNQTENNVNIFLIVKGLDSTSVVNIFKNTTTVKSRTQQTSWACQFIVTFLNISILVYWFFTIVLFEIFIG